MNIICLDCSLADPEAIWEYDDLVWDLSHAGDATRKELAVLLLKHRTHRLVIL